MNHEWYDNVLSEQEADELKRTAKLVVAQDEDSKELIMIVFPVGPDNFHQLFHFIHMLAITSETDMLDDIAYAMCHEYHDNDDIEPHPFSNEAFTFFVGLPFDQDEEP
jgi:hypothetical protein